MQFVDVLAVTRCWVMIAWLAVLSGCGGQAVRMEHPEEVHGRYHEQIAVAKRLLEENEKWSTRAEWEVIKTSDGWDVIAWRVEHPDQKGPARYLPWGYSVIKLDRRMAILSYHARG